MPTLADVVHRQGPAYLQRFGSRMSADQHRALRDIARCRTPALGGHLWLCPQCGMERFAYHSCGNRHCPACGADDARRWLDRQQALLLPVTYHLVTFTVPEALRGPIRSHPRELLPVLFKAGVSGLLDLCAEPAWLGAMPGVTAVLHTWTRSLIYHPHVHALVTGGGVAPDGSWRWAHPRFLIPVKALSPVFRARFRAALRARLPHVYATIPPSVWEQDWVVHAKPVGSGEQALRYLSRYLFRVALSNAALVALDERTVTFRYRQSEDGVWKSCTLPHEEFLRRFLQHVLPSRFIKVRYFGLHHARRRAAIPLLRAALHLALRQPLPEPPPPRDTPPPCLCPRCRTPMRRDRRLPPDPHWLEHPLETSPP